MSLRTPRRRRKSGGITKRLQERLQAVTDEAGLMRAASLPPPDDGPHRTGAGLVAGARRRDAAAAERLAETLIVAARDWLYAACCKEWGTPCNAEGQPQPLLILGMGKLGGGELNFSSDIDLIFAAGAWRHPRRPPRAG